MVETNHAAQIVMKRGAADSLGGANSRRLDFPPFVILPGSIPSLRQEDKRNTIVKDGFCVRYRLSF